ncbi:hypothetical protein B0A50_08433 [Salinomyces thailandicus]|uniref:Coupling of ubiquitin conjugation to ER degradation protein 1 n=1 Tax=Salinomyces thailandicus TaxID=706561 RepID=A0A4U0TJR4_9PEZI|nr:hypothetical protein B0A50_08433 [Salinomyces thailandica]
MAEAQSTINIPQILAVAVVGFLAIRWWLSKPSGPTQEPRSQRPRTVDVVKVEQVAAMFPQLDRRTIAWDLQRNGQNVQATTERVLAGRSLDNPPPSFQPPNLASAGTQAPAVGVSGAASQQGKVGGQAQQDLIARYNLQAKVSGKGKEAVPSEEAQRQRSAWSSDKAARADGLRRRREEMVLAARRKMEEKEGKGSAA